MLSEIVYSVIFIVFSIFLYENFGYRTRPPGPWRFPLIGTLVQIILSDKVYFLGLHNLSKKYGEIMSLKIGFTDVVILASHESTKCVLNNEDSHDRFIVGPWKERNLNQNIGIVMGNGNNTIEIRKFVRENLRKYGFGNRQALEVILHNELDELLDEIDTLRSNNGLGIVQMSHKLIDPFAMNILLTMFIGKRLRAHNAIVQNLIRSNKEFVSDIFVTCGLLMAFPMLKYFKTKLHGYETQMRGLTGLHQAAKDVLNARKLDGSYKTAPSCFTDDFLVEIERNADNPVSLITEEQFQIVFVDLIQAGFDTSSNMVNYIILLLAIYPDKQRKVYEEIENICGLDRNPSLSDKAKMSYMNAVIVETLRIVRVLPIGLPRKAKNDIPYKNFVIKKDTVIVPNFHSMFYDEKVWKDPQNYKPERFIDQDGLFLKHKADKVVAFGMGGRKCFGEIIAMDILFFFITRLIQKYSFQLPEDESSMTPSLDPMIVGVTLCPKPYTVQVKLRNGTNNE